MFIGYLIHAELQVDPELLLGQAADDFTAGTAASGKRRKLRGKNFGWFLPWFLRCIPRIRDWFTFRRSSFFSCPIWTKNAPRIFELCGFVSLKSLPAHQPWRG
jgi:hypothetical protein